MPYISKGRRYTYGVKTLEELRTLTGMSTGDTAFCSDNFRLMTYDGELWMCNDFIKLTNTSAVTLVPGDVVIVSSVSANSCTRTATAGSALVLGPVVFGAANNSPVAVAIYGIYDVKSLTSTNHGDFARTAASASFGDSTTIMGQGVFGVFVSSNAAANGLAKCFIRSYPEAFL